MSAIGQINVHPRQGMNVYLDTPHEVMGTLVRTFQCLCGV